MNLFCRHLVLSVDSNLKCDLIFRGAPQDAMYKQGTMGWTYGLFIDRLLLYLPVG
jgi:hypothetical protein